MTKTSAQYESKAKQSNGSTKALAIPIPTELYEAFSARCVELQYPQRHVVQNLINQWLRGDTVIPMPFDQLPAELTSRLSELLTIDPGKSEAIQTFLANLGKAPGPKKNGV